MMILSLLTRLSKYREYYTLLSEFKATIIVDIILPLMAATETEKQDMIEDPE